MHLEDEGAEAFAKGCEGVFDVGAFGAEVPAMEDAIQFEFAQLGGEDFLTDTGQGFAEVRVAARAVEEFAQDEDLPLAGDDGEEAFDFTFNGLEFHIGQALKGALLLKSRSGAS